MGGELDSDIFLNRFSERVDIVDRRSSSGGVLSREEQRQDGQNTSARSREQQPSTGKMLQKTSRVSACAFGAVTLRFCLRLALVTHVNSSPVNVTFGRFFSSVRFSAPDANLRDREKNHTVAGFSLKNPQVPGRP